MIPNLATCLDGAIDAETGFDASSLRENGKKSAKDCMSSILRICGGFYDKHRMMNRCIERWNGRHGLLVFELILPQASGFVLTVHTQLVCTVERTVLQASMPLGGIILRNVPLLHVVERPVMKDHEASLETEKSSVSSLPTAGVQWVTRLRFLGDSLPAFSTDVAVNSSITSRDALCFTIYSRYRLHASIQSTSWPPSGMRTHEEATQARRSTMSLPK